MVPFVFQYLQKMKLFEIFLGLTSMGKQEVWCSSDSMHNRPIARTLTTKLSGQKTGTTTLPCLHKNIVCGKAMFQITSEQTVSKNSEPLYLSKKIFVVLFPRKLIIGRKLNHKPFVTELNDSLHIKLLPIARNCYRYSYVECNDLTRENVVF